MNDVPPPLHPLLTPDGIAGMVLAALTGLAVGFRERVGVFGTFISALTASVVTGVAVPIFVAKGFTWADWLGVAILLCAVTSTAIFVVALLITRKMQAIAEERSTDLATLIFDALLGRFLPKKGG